MDAEESKFILENPKGKKPSEIGESIEVLLRQYRPKNRAKGGYKKLSEAIGKRRLKVSGHGSFALSQIHRVYRLLPQGIRWKIDQRGISVAHGLQITRLKSEKDQWVLALAAAAERLSVKQCESIVKHALKKPESGEKDYSLREALNRVAGFPFEDIPNVIDMSSPEEWISISKEAWNRKMDWENFCHRLIAQKSSVLSDMEKMAEQISQWRQDFLKSSHEEINQKLQSLEAIANGLRQLAELRQPPNEEAVQKAEAEEKGKPNGDGNSEENPSDSTEKEAVVQSGGDEPKSTKPSKDGKQPMLLNSGGGKSKGKRKKEVR